MPKYIDYHSKMPELPAGMVQEIQSEIKAGKRDPNGVKLLNGFFSTDGQGWCLCEADSPEAVCKAHEAKGMHLEKSDVYEVKTLV